MTEGSGTMAGVPTYSLSSKMVDSVLRFGTASTKSLRVTVQRILLSVLSGPTSGGRETVLSGLRVTKNVFLAPSISWLRDLEVANQHKFDFLVFNQVPG